MTHPTTTRPSADPRPTAAPVVDEVPFLDVAAPYRGPLGPAVRAAVDEIFRTGRFAQGARVAELEAAFAAHCGTRHAIAVASGTDALALALRSLRLEPGDEVVTTAMSFVATAEAIVLAGGRPVFVDVDERTLQIDPEAVAAACTERTVGILPVHLYGGTADLDAIERVARERGLWVLEDAAQAHGARFAGRRAGSFGVAGCFSFYPGKNLGTCGEGGMVVTDDDALARDVRLFRDHGAERKYEHLRLGTNARMSELEAAVLALKLPYLDGWNAERRALAERYAEGLRGLPIELTATTDGAESVHHLFVVRTPDREGLRARLAERGIQTGIHYPHPLHVLPAVGGSEAARGSLPHAERAAEQVLSLPMFPELGPERVERVCAAIAECVDPPAALPGR
jgi:dTDP-4-amino-4,6-dideoxygalactose transaminase